VGAAWLGAWSGVTEVPVWLEGAWLVWVVVVPMVGLETGVVTVLGVLLELLGLVRLIDSSLKFLCYALGVVSLGRRLTQQGRKYPNGETRILFERMRAIYLRERR
jgi:hypothetical protein